MKVKVGCRRWPNPGVTAALAAHAAKTTLAAANTKIIWPQKLLFRMLDCS
jgi:hypothetical protein